MADSTLPGGGSISLPAGTPAATVAAVADAIASLAGQASAGGTPITSSVTLTDFSSPPSQDPTVLTVYAISASQLTGTTSLPVGPHVAFIVTGNSPISLNVPAGSIGFAIAATGDSNNTINVSGGSGTIVVGDGDNVIGTPKATSSSLLDSRFETTTTKLFIKTGDGDNKIFLGTGDNTVITGTGDNTVGLGSGSNLVYSQGNDTLIAGSGNQTIGAGAGTVNMFAGTGHSTLIGGSGNDQIFLGTGAGNVAVAGTGHTTIVGGTGANTFIGGNSSTSVALISGGTGNETIFGGAGHETLLGGGGSNLFAFTSASSLGGGDNVIGDFDKAHDTIGFIGYGTSSDILSHSTVVGGNTIINLSDGTKITLVGVTGLTSSNLVAG